MKELMSTAEVNAAWDREEKAGLAAAIERNRQHVEKIDSLRGLAGDFLFKEYRKELTKEVEHLKEALAAPGCPNSDILRGQILGLRRAIHFFEMRAEEAKIYEEDSAAHRNELALLEDRATTYGREGGGVPTPN